MQHEEMTTEQRKLIVLIEAQWKELGLTEDEFLVFGDATWSAYTLDGLARTLRLMLLAKDAGAFDVCKGKSILPILNQSKAGNDDCLTSLINNWVTLPLL